MMNYIDSSIIIASYFPDDPHHKEGKKVMEDIEKGEEGIISIFGIAEIGGFLTRNSSPEDSEEFVTQLSRFPNLYIWYTSDFKGFMNTVAELSITKGLSGADAIHAVSALSISEVEKIITLDRDFRKISDSIDVELLI
ncbi:MAG: type II toxin-antitoxin system VapC family toxin [Thermoplasmata archaeon]